MRFSSVFALTTVIPLAVGIACSDDDEILPLPLVDAGPDGSLGSGGNGGGMNEGGIPDAGDPCESLAQLCHEVSPGTGVLEECHEVGHDGDQATCAAEFAGCRDSCGAALCELLSTRCHGGTGAAEECHELGHDGNAGACFDQAEHCLEVCQSDGGHDAGSMPVTLQFKAKIGSADFACGTTYPDFGSSHSEVSPRSLRFYVNELKLINDHGDEVPVVMDTRSPWQTPDVALIDFADDAGDCGGQTPETNTIITGTVPADTYTGIVFSNGVPEGLNHADPATAPDPLQAGMSWGWLFGHIFFQAELQSVPAALDGGAADGGTLDGGAVDGGTVVPGQVFLHLGSTGCENEGTDAGPDFFAPPSVACTNQNRNRVELTGFDPAANSIVVDLEPIFGMSDITLDAQCHSDGPYCDPWFEAVGVSFTTGAALTTQTVYSVE